MNELNNTATSVVNMIEGLTLTKEADKDNWVDGFLTYIITLDNQTNTTYESPIITDVLDDTLVEFVNDSVTINSQKADSSKYNYDNDTHTLTINLDDVTPSGSTTLTFLVAKKA